VCDSVDLIMVCVLKFTVGQVCVRVSATIRSGAVVCVCASFRAAREQLYVRVSACSGAVVCVSLAAVEPLGGCSSVELQWSSSVFVLSWSGAVVCVCMCVGLLWPAVCLVLAEVALHMVHVSRAECMGVRAGWSSGAFRVALQCVSSSTGAVVYGF